MSDISASEGQTRAPGPERPLSRRDFLDGIAMTAGLAAVGSGDGGTPALETPLGTAASGTAHGATATPGRTGWHGDTAHALSVPHALRDGRFWEHAGPAVPTGERYDLVVVGAGASGLSAAAEWLRADPDARVLILDNHEQLGERRRKPGRAPYDSVMCDRESFPVETLIRHRPGSPAERWISRLPVADQARKDLLRLYLDAPDWFPRLTPEEKEERLAGSTYSDFLLKVCRAHPDVERFCRTMSSAEWAYDTRALGAIDAWGCADRRAHGRDHGGDRGRGRSRDQGRDQGRDGGWEYPGLDGLGLDAGKPSRFNSPSVQRDWRRRPGDLSDSADPLIPGPAGAPTGLLATASLDRPGDPVRLRLSSPVVSVRDEGPRGGASVGYFDGHEVRTVAAEAVILACWSMVIPYLAPDLPADQREALAAAVRLPLVEAVVRLRDGRAWQRVGVTRTRWTGAYWCTTELDEPDGPEGGGPVTARLVAAPCRSELGPAEGAVAGRRALYRTPYRFLEHSARDQLARLLGPGGFDPARDIEGIEIRRWGHGRAAEYCRPWNAFYPDGPFPAEVARRRFGRIAIAGSDTAVGRTDGAVAAARRAVAELSR
ncbi:NAD(P)-binding protein [Nonomuraea sp. NPDC049714]|uniref:NAD(P)-binding protein n=1 Tax=Nonomuraea sp. NPDC049714 TaxID=3364357 RepID=UPI0037A81131